jgi:hypothetical protein
MDSLTCIFLIRNWAQEDHFSKFYPQQIPVGIIKAVAKGIASLEQKGPVGEFDDDLQ